MCRAFRKSSKLSSWLSKGALLGGALFLSGCSASLPFVRQNKAYSRIYLTDFATAWTAALEAAANGRSDVIKSNNRETGTVDTAWIDNSESRQFLDVFADADFFLRSRYKFQVQVREGRKNDQPAVMVRVLKQMQQEATFLGGFQDVESDGIEENVFLYRIGRLIAIQQHADTSEDPTRAVGGDDDATLF